jgi:hypothetical protein
MPKTLDRQTLPEASPLVCRCLRSVAAVLIPSLVACGGGGTVGPSPSPQATPSQTPTQSTPPRTPMTYYVSPSGNDAGPGTLDQPFATIRTGAGRLFAGDVLYVRDGNYRETVSVPRSGTASAPITIEAYPGECPTLIGATLVSGPWTPHSGAIYKAAWSTQPTQVFADGHLLNEARWPNTPVEDFAGMTYALADAGSSTSITYAGLPSVDLTGAWVNIMAGQAWVAYNRQVASHERASGRLSFSPPVNALAELVPRRGNHFYLFGKLELLDSPGEWHWDAVGHALYVWTPDGASPEGRVEAGIAPAVLSLDGQSYVTVKGLSIRGGWVSLQGSNSCTIQDCHLWAPNWIRAADGYSVWPQHLGGVEVSGSGNLVQGGSVRLAGRESIHIAGTSNTVRQSTVENSGWNGAGGGAIDLAGAEKAVVENCTVRRSAMSGIGLAPLSRVAKNLVESSCLFVEDCGNVGAWSMDGQGTEIAENVIRGNKARWGAGIYLDAGSRNFDLHDNLIEHMLWGGMNITGINLIDNNTMLDFRHQGIAFVPPAGSEHNDWSTGRVAHNQIAEAFPLFVQLSQPVSMIPDYAWYVAYTTLAPQPGPRRVELDWTDFAQPGWQTQAVPLDLSRVDSIFFGTDTTGASFNYTITNLRLLPIGETADAGAVPVAGTSWRAECNSPSTCSLSASGPVTWGASGTHAFGGSNRLAAPLPASLTNLAAYRGLAFDLAGTTTRKYDHQRYQDVDNGAEAAAGRGASLPASVGADPSGAWPPCHTSTTSR